MQPDLACSYCHKSSISLSLRAVNALFSCIATSKILIWGGSQGLTTTLTGMFYRQIQLLNNLNHPLVRPYQRCVKINCASTMHFANTSSGFIKWFLTSRSWKPTRVQIMDLEWHYETEISKEFKGRSQGEWISKSFSHFLWNKGVACHTYECVRPQLRECITS